MITLGIDLSTSRKNTSYCRIDWSVRTPRVVTVPTTPAAGNQWESLHAAIAESDKVAIDVPLGWPAAFSREVSAHAKGEAWTADRDKCLWRVTDRRVAQVKGADGKGARPPLSVSANLIGATAMDAAKELGRYSIDRSGRSGKFCEVYPAVAIRRWGFQDVGYKGADSSEQRNKLVNLVLAVIPWASAAPGLQALVCGDDNHLDSFLCALIARLVAIGSAEGPSDDELEMARIEGWIWLPQPGSLTSITSGATA